MTAQKCVITRHVAHRPERPHAAFAHEVAAGVDGDDAG
jgi:hypothetical protein